MTVPTRKWIRSRVEQLEQLAPATADPASPAAPVAAPSTMGHYGFVFDRLM
jgi:hypothetical protein